MARVANHANFDSPGFQVIGKLALRARTASGYVSVDWYTSAALPTQGDGRLFVTGTEGSIEIRRYVDVAGRPGTNHLRLVNGKRYEHLDGSGSGLPYCAALAADTRDRTETACLQARTFDVCRLAMVARAMADGALERPLRTWAERLPG